MPFVVACPFCGQRSKVADGSLGASAQCPRCGSFMTLAPQEEPTSAGALAGPATAPVPTVLRPTPLDSMPAGNVNARSQSAPEDPAIRWAEKGLAKRPWVEPWAVAGLCLAGASLLSASFPLLCRLVIPLSAVGLLAAVMGLWRARVMSKSRRFLPLAATIMSAAVLLSAWRWPSLLGPIYEASRPRPTVDAAAMRAVPLPGSRGVDPAETEWVDASRAALQQGGTLARIMDVWIGPAEEPANKNRARPQHLFVRLQVFHASHKNGQSIIDPIVGLRARLTDDTDKVYEVSEGLASSKRSDDKRVLSGLAPEKVFAFTPAPAEPKYLRFELAATTPGSSRPFRFTIPASMIARERPR